MPKRTNEFQGLVTRIVKQLTASGATVSESVLLPERREGEDLREVDTLLFVDMGFFRLTVAIESRDHNRKQSIQWIDELDGKYRQLDVDKVIAVSSSGFTKSAMRKAADCGILLYSLEEALSNDWPSSFIEVGLVGLTLNLHPALGVEMYFENISLQADFLKDAALRRTSEQGEVSEIPLSEYVQALFVHTFEMTRDRLKESFLDLYSTPEELKKYLVVEYEHHPAFSCVVSQGQVECINKLVLRMHFNPEIEEGTAITNAFTQAGCNDPVAVVTNAEVFGTSLQVIQTLGADSRAAPRTHSLP